MILNFLGTTPPFLKFRLLNAYPCLIYNFLSILRRFSDWGKLFGQNCMTSFGQKTQILGYDLIWSKIYFSELIWPNKVAHFWPLKYAPCLTSYG